MASLIQNFTLERALDRDKARVALDAHLAEAKASNNLEESTKALEPFVQELLSSDDWIQIVGSFTAAFCLVKNGTVSEEFRTICYDAIKKNLEHPEVRVRHAVAELVEALAAGGYGRIVFQALQPNLVESIHNNFHRSLQDGPDASGVLPPRSGHTSPASTPPGTPRKVDGMHDTEGWKCLETSVGVLRRCIEGAGKEFEPDLSMGIRELLVECTAHTNRFVRETGYFTIRAIVASLSEELILNELADQFSPLIAKGMADNWSQVRYAASVAGRSYLERVKRDKDVALLMPPLCLNRYYVAEGVRLYSQETWKRIVGQQGAQVLADNAAVFAKFYVQQSEMDNHAVREAACACIAEMAAKVDKAAVAPLVGMLLEALIASFQDQSWPVRDAACTSCSAFVTAFPDESAGYLEQLYPLWIDHLSDNIKSVREGAAIALGRVLKAHPDRTLPLVLGFLRDNLGAAQNQEAESQRFGDMEKQPGPFGVVQSKHDRDNDKALHTGQIMYSCGSLAPRLKRGPKGGCMDHTVDRPKQPWELSDGSMFLLTELAESNPDQAAEFMTVVAKIAGLTHFSHHHYLHETIWNQVPLMAKHMGKRPFKQHLEELLPAMVWAVGSEHQNASHAASTCVSEISRFIGPNIFKGRLEADQARKLAERGLIAP